MALHNVEGVLEQPSISLVDAARLGDADAFARLVGPELASALGAARLVLRSSSDAADAVQDALVSAWRDLPRLREPLAFSGWFRTHVVRSAYRIARRRGSVVRLDTITEPAIDDLDERLTSRRLDRAFGTLSPADRLILTLHFHWGQPMTQTAVMLRIPEGTVKSRVHHAIRRLRAAMDAEDRR